MKSFVTICALFALLAVQLVGLPAGTADPALPVAELLEEAFFDSAEGGTDETEEQASNGPDFDQLNTSSWLNSVFQIPASTNRPLPFKRAGARLAVDAPRAPPAFS